MLNYNKYKNCDTDNDKIRIWVRSIYTAGHLKSRRRHAASTLESDCFRSYYGKCNAPLESVCLRIVYMRMELPHSTERPGVMDYTPASYPEGTQFETPLGERSVCLSFLCAFFLSLRSI
jgi:hypothetical protein